MANVVDFDAILEKLNLLPALVNKVQAIQDGIERERPEVMDYRDAARYLKLGVTTIQQYVSAGTIPYRKFGAAVRFLRSELDEWMMSKRIDKRGICGRANGGATRKSGFSLHEL